MARIEHLIDVASLLDERRADPTFGGDPYQHYGGRSLHEMSHGEAFLSVMKNRFSQGLFLLDEPESALSPQRQLALLAIMYDLTRSGTAQFLIATHSPVLLTFPDARIISFDDQRLPQIPLTDTKHYQITRGILNSPESYWKHLRIPDPETQQTLRGTLNRTAENGVAGQTCWCVATRPTITLRRASGSGGTWRNGRSRRPSSGC